MDQTTIKKEDPTAAAPHAAASTQLPVATPVAAGATTADTNKRPAPVGNGSLATAAPVAKKPNTAVASASSASQKTQLQQQIQQQLQQQLQAQLQAAAARGQQANITPEQIQVSFDFSLFARTSSIFLCKRRPGRSKPVECLFCFFEHRKLYSENCELTNSHPFCFLCNFGIHRLGTSASHGTGSCPGSGRSGCR